VSPRLGRINRVVRPALVDAVPRDHRQGDGEFQRRRVVAAITLVVGATLLAFSLATAPGSSAFYPLTFSVAAVWVVGGLLSGPLHLGYRRAGASPRRPVLTPVVLGILAGATFIVGALIVREIGPLRDFVAHVLAHARKGNLTLVAGVTLLNGVGEEVFFRGALFAAIGRNHAVPISTAIYALVTVATGNPMLVFAAVVMGALFALQRRATGGILAPLLTHLVWSMIMLLALPPLFS
jgi:membrane protease YdiL (CAAX protease family)